jgi:hypothetical protein
MHHDPELATLREPQPLIDGPPTQETEGVLTPKYCA